MSVSVTPPTGYTQPLPIPLGPNRQANDLRLAFISASGVSGGALLEMQLQPDPPTGFTAAYSLNPGHETHAAYYRRLTATDADTVNVDWDKPTNWQHFLFATLTARGVSPTTNPTGGSLSLKQTQGDTTVAAASVTVPGAGVMVFLMGTVPDPWVTSGVAPSWAISLGAPTGWTNLVATDKSGATFFQYGTDPSLIVVAKTFSASGTTGVVSFPSAQGAAAFAGLYLFLTPASDSTVSVGAA
ncbi:MAG TPA: hypothetical protein VH084_28470 [Mycobacterium sp.]|jgi:hypothetical protein|nr:hypothetical protein [Mycobacterium sp.]